MTCKRDHHVLRSQRSRPLRGIVLRAALQELCRPTRRCEPRCIGWRTACRQRQVYRPGCESREFAIRCVPSIHPAQHTCHRLGPRVRDDDSRQLCGEQVARSFALPTTNSAFKLVAGFSKAPRLDMAATHTAPSSLRQSQTGRALPGELIRTNRNELNVGIVLACRRPSLHLVRNF